MRIATLRNDDQEAAAIRLASGYLPLRDIIAAGGTQWPETVWELIVSGRLGDLSEWWKTQKQALVSDLERKVIAIESVHAGPLFRSPSRIWGIGLNYADHAADLDENAPETIPGSFMKPVTTIIGPGDTIRIPRLSQRTTA